MTCINAPLTNIELMQNNEKYALYDNKFIIGKSGKIINVLLQLFLQKEISMR